MKEKKFFLFFSFFFFLIFIFFTYLVKNDFFTKIDFDLMVKIQNFIPKKYDYFLSFFSLIGSFEVYTLIILLIIIFIQKKILSFLIFIPFIGAHIIEILGKTFLTQPNPPFFFHRFKLFFNFPSSYVQPGNAYPSGHSLRTVFVVFLLIYLILKSKTKFFLKILFISCLLLFNFLMLISRISLGEHWPSDVVGGFFLGLSAVFFSFLAL